MTVEDILNLSPQQIARLNEKEIRAATTILGSAANKRLKRALTKDTLSPAIRGMQRSGGKISVSGKMNINQVRAEFYRAKSFMEAKTSTAKGFQKSTAEFASRIGVKNISKEESNAFWDIYSRIQSQNPFIIQMVGSGEVQKMIGDYMSDNGNIDSEALTESGKDAIVSELLNYGQEQYETYAQEMADWEKGLTDEYFELDWEDMEDY